MKLIAIGSGANFNEEKVTRDTGNSGLGEEKIQVTNFRYKTG